MQFTIRSATVEDLARVEKCARKFYASSRFLKSFKLEVFQRTWTTLFAQDCGVIFLICDESDEIVGALGGVAYPDTNSGELCAMEFFWFIEAESRGRGLELYRAFELWARLRGCVEMRLCHMLDSMPEKLAKVYKRLGFTPVEVHYSKELLPCP